jgi:hypothetical protein
MDGMSSLQTIYYGFQREQMGGMYCLQIINHMVKSVLMGCHDCHKYNGRRWIWSFMPLQLAINIQSEYPLYYSSTAAAFDILTAVSLELSKH